MKKFILKQLKCLSKTKAILHTNEEECLFIFAQKIDLG